MTLVAADLRPRQSAPTLQLAPGATCAPRRPHLTTPLAPSSTFVYATRRARPGHGLRPRVAPFAAALDDQDGRRSPRPAPRGGAGSAQREPGARRSPVRK